MRDKRQLRSVCVYLALLCGAIGMLLSCNETDGPEPGNDQEDISVVLHADKEEITADGNQSVTFTVKVDAQDVTRESTIFMDEGDCLEGNVFVPVAAGEFTFHAVYDDVISNTVMVTVLEVQAPVDPEEPVDPEPPVDPEEPMQPQEGRSIVFVEGVTSAGGWYDVNKMGEGSLNGDINMCWAAASSNMIQWWQDRYVAAGNQLPASSVNGPGTIFVESSGRTYELALMEMFHSQWNNENGCHTTEAIPWYFEGANYGQTATAGSQAYPLTDGGYWSEVWSSVYPHLYHEYTYMFGWYTGLYTAEYTAYGYWGNGSSVPADQRYKTFSDYVVQFIGRGITSMTITLNPNGGLNHATTVWGYEIDNATGLLTRLWITDSDDLTSEPKQQLLNEYEVSYNTGDKYITLASDSVRYGKCYVISLNPFSGYGSGEIKTLRHTRH